MRERRRPTRVRPRAARTVAAAGGVVGGVFHRRFHPWGQEPFGLRCGSRTDHELWLSGCAPAAPAVGALPHTGSDWRPVLRRHAPGDYGQRPARLLHWGLSGPSWPSPRRFRMNARTALSTSSPLWCFATASGCAVTRGQEPVGAYLDEHGDHDRRQGPHGRQQDCRCLGDQRRDAQGHRDALGLCQEQCPRRRWPRT